MHIHTHTHKPSLTHTPMFSSSPLLTTHTHTSLPHTHPSPSPDLEFFLIGIHTQPSNVLAELNALVEVYEEAVNRFGTENGIMLGDFNADCSYLSQRRYNMLLLVTDSRFTWLLDTNIDSTTGNSNCAYDRYAWCSWWWRGELCICVALAENLAKSPLISPPNFITLASLCSWELKEIPPFFPHLLPLIPSLLFSFPSLFPPLLLPFFLSFPPLPLPLCV